MHRILSAVLAAAFTLGVSSAGDFGTEMLEATFKLADPDATSTCFFVHRDAPDTALYLVTAGHALEKTKGPTATVVLRKLKPDGSYERLDHTLAIRREGKPLWVKNPGQDIAVLKLTEPLPIPVAALPLSALADEARLNNSDVHICTPIFILTYPRTFETTKSGFPAARQGIVASPLLLPLKDNPTFFADFTNFSGDSGGPVFIPGPDKHPLVLGIVLAQHFHDERVKTEYEEVLIHHPFELGTVVHAQFLRDTIEMASQPASR